jgi:hypothetical protein
MNATTRLTPKTGAMTRATMKAVMQMPGKTSMPSPKAVLEMTRSEIPTPPWNRIMETPRVKMS